MRPSTPSGTAFWVLVALLALAAVLLAPSAAGATRPDDTAGAHGIGAVAIATGPVHPNDRAGALGAGAATLVVQPTHPNDRAGVLGVEAATASPNVVVATVDTASGYDWGQIVLVGGVAIVMVLLVGAATVTLREHRGPGRPVPH